MDAILTPWTAIYPRSLRDAHGRTVAAIQPNGVSAATDFATARRIVLCVNACAGLSDRQLAAARPGDPAQSDFLTELYALADGLAGAGHPFAGDLNDCAVLVERRAATGALLVELFGRLAANPELAERLANALLADVYAGLAFGAAATVSLPEERLDAE